MRRTIAALVAITALTGCASELRQFPMKDPLWVDQDKRPFTAEPEEYFSSFLWDGADQMVFRPFAKFWKVDPGGESVNVNALDEVPDSAWFTNRIGRRNMSLDEVRRGACAGVAPLDPAKGPWTVTGAKPNGANPGFPIKAADGRRYLLKFDGVVQGPRATAADTLVSKIYYAAGFDTPCNEIVHFDRTVLRIAPDARSEDDAGNKIKMTEADLDKVFSKAIRLPDGRYRGSASLFLKGKPIGPFRYEETRDDDPNDVVPHEERRELRASYVLAAWTNHFDSREQNTLDMYVKVPGKGGYIQHNIIDFGDCLGSVWEPPLMGRRIGHSHYLALDHVFTDLITFGFYVRPWDNNEFSKTGPVLGYFQIDNFVPEAWRPGYPNPAMLRMTERDAAWMARIVARMSPAHIQSIVSAAEIKDPMVVNELTRVLMGRRHKVLARWLSRVSSLTEPTVGARGGMGELCMEDRGAASGVFPTLARKYGARAWLGYELNKQAIPTIRTAPKVCVDLPPVRGASAANPRYLVVDMYAYTGSENRAPARVHLYHLGGSDYRVVGLERPYDNEPPPKKGS